MSSGPPFAVRGLLRVGPALLVAAALVAAAGCAGGDEAARAPRAAPEETARHTLWRVDDGSEADTLGTAYLLGSIHVARPEALYPLADPIRAAFAAAEVVAFELDLDQAEARAAMLARRGLLPEGRTLADVIPDSTGRLLRAALDSLGRSITPFRRMKPWLVSLALPAASLQGTGYRAEAGLDRHFFDEAGAAGKERVALETLAEQIAIFDSLSNRAQSRLLHAALRDRSRSRAYLDALTAAWSAGDTAALASRTARPLRAHPGLRRRLLTARNRRWTPQIEQLLRRADTSLVVVGAGHLVGEKSVVALLRREGYVVEQR